MGKRTKSTTKEKVNPRKIAAQSLGVNKYLYEQVTVLRKAKDIERNEKNAANRFCSQTQVTILEKERNCSDRSAFVCFWSWNGCLFGGILHYTLDS